MLVENDSDMMEKEILEEVGIRKQKNVCGGQDYDKKVGSVGAKDRFEG